MPTYFTTDLMKNKYLSAHVSTRIIELVMIKYEKLPTKSTSHCAYNARKYFFAYTGNELIYFLSFSCKQWFIQIFVKCYT
jgi:hypothetical protein